MIRLPAEWEPQSAILLTWPHRNSLWDYQLDAVEQTHLNIARAVLRDQNLIISCEDPDQLARVRSELEAFASAHGTRLDSYLVPADDVWARDHGPIGVFDNGQLILLDFVFNAWGNKYAFAKDDRIISELFAQHAFANATLRQVNLILEGGSIESDGHGTLLTTEPCLLSPQRNPTLSKADIEQQLKRHLGVQRVLWLAHGAILGDDTDGHIDTLARFCSADTLCYVQCTDPTDPHFAELHAMEQELKAFEDYRGQPYQLVPLPMPTAIIENGRRLAATYANFLITNHAVLVPVYAVPEDEQALAILARCFPGRDIRPVNCRSLIRQNGSLHCVTMQIPALPNLQGNKP